MFVGTNFGHGSAVAALDAEGNLVFAVEEGRLIGIKNCERFPVTALRTLIDNYGTEGLRWAEGWSRWKRFLNKGLCTTLKYGVSDTSYVRSRFLKEIRRLDAGLRAEREWRFLLGRPSFSGHHLAHAFSLLPWGLPAKSVVVVSDTTAESASISVFYWSGCSMEPLLEVPYPHSPCAVFHQMAAHLGFRGRTAPGKLMALAAYGKPLWADELRSICRMTDRGLRLDLHRFPNWHRTGAWLRFARDSASRSLRTSVTAALGARERAPDLACSLQEWFTTVSLDVVRHAVQIARDLRGYEVRHVGLAGGAALNCQTNGCVVRARHTFGIDSVTVGPWSDDAGTAIGAAVWLFHKSTGMPPRIVSNPFLGPQACSNPENVSKDDILAAARILECGGIVALASGRLEFGPRALGGRCLLGDPRSTAVRDRLNVLKERPSFMPCAPAILEGDFSKYFAGEGSTSMAWTVTSTARAVREIPGGIHANGQARVQVVQKGTTTLLSRVLETFRDLTGTGALLLTSLNGKNEPIAADVTIAKGVVRRMGIEGMLSDVGWQQSAAS